MVLYQKTFSYLGDSDRQYHLGLSKLLVDAGSLHLEKLPQAEDVGWGDYFPDKEYLFHVLTSFAYRAAGERGAVAAVLLVAVGSAWILYAFALGWLTPPLALACAFSAFFSTALVFRLLMLRPHVLALFCFLLLQFAILRRRPVLCFFAAAAFVLAYHAFYIPLISLGLVAVLAFAEPKGNRMSLWKIVGVGFAGFVVGIVVNPYFPSNVMIGILVARIPFLMNGALKGAHFGMELYPVLAPGMLKLYYLPFLILLAALAGLGRKDGWLRLPNDFTSRYLLLFTLFFGLLSFQTLRAGEYFIPLAGLLLAPVLGGLEPWLRNRCALVLMAAQLFNLVYTARTEAGFEPDKIVTENTWSAIAAIPPGPAKVYNCDWDTAGFLLRARPDLRFVDLLDPTLLFAANPGLHKVRYDLDAGAVTDPRAAVASVFNSTYVLCRDRMLNDQLAFDGGFQQLYPRRDSPPSVMSLFRVASRPSPAFVRSFRMKVVEGDIQAARAFVPGAGADLRPIELPKDFMQSLSLRELRRPGLNCAHFRAADSEVKRLSGASYLGVGGGEALRVWRNGKLLFASGRAYPRTRSVQALLHLEPSLASGDRLDLLVCSGAEAPYWAVALSFWSRQELEKTCAWKREFAGFLPNQSGEPAYSGDALSCLGPMASPSVPSGLR